MKRRAYDVRVFKCTECGSVNFAAKSRGWKSGKGHIKDIYCYKCQKTTKHMQEDVK